MALRVTSAPAAEPIDLTAAKAHLRLVGTEEDTYVTALIARARHLVEICSGRSLITQTLVATFDKFPDCRVLELERPPVQSVTSVAYLDSDGNSQTFSSLLYTADIYSSPARIVLKDGESWPVTAMEANAVTVTYVAGYGASGASVPDPLLHGLLFLLGHFYANRESVIAAPVQVTELPKTFDWLIGPYKVYR